MQDYWIIETHGDPIGAVRRLLRTVWNQVQLEGLLVSENGGSGAHWINSPDGLDSINPFRPVMRENLARRVPKAIRDHPQSRLGVLLRPCEMRALLEIGKRIDLSDPNLITLSVDCLGTYPEEEFEWRAARKGSADDFGGETLKFARQGGILAYRHRPACQMCASPGAHSADLNLHVLGLPVREKMLLQFGGENKAEWLHLGELCDGKADESLTLMHEHVLSRQAAFHHQTMERVMQALEDLLPKDLDAVIAQLEGCGDCQKCMAVCPICSVEFPRRDADGHYPREAVRDWLFSCAGCGMCEQACKNNLPLAVIFGSIRERLKSEPVEPIWKEWVQ